MERKLQDSPASECADRFLDWSWPRCLVPYTARVECLRRSYATGSGGEGRGRETRETGTGEHGCWEPGCCGARTVSSPDGCQLNEDLSRAIGRMIVYVGTSSDGSSALDIRELSAIVQVGPSSTSLGSRSPLAISVFASTQYHSARSRHFLSSP